MPAISASVTNRQGQHDVSLTTNDRQHSLTIPSGASGFGSSANGGELLFLALATCYCNDIYREAAKQNITVRSVEVTVNGEFDPVPGSVARNVTYSARVEAEATAEQIEALMRHTDTVAEIHNTLRQAGSVTLTATEAIPV
jgi:organic hydroperoxide reductase OsmC/OhrA